MATEKPDKVGWGHPHVSGNVGEGHLFGGMLS